MIYKEGALFSAPFFLEIFFSGKSKAAEWGKNIKKGL